MDKRTKGQKEAVAIGMLKPKTHNRQEPPDPKGEDIEIENEIEIEVEN